MWSRWRATCAAEPHPRSKPSSTRLRLPNDPPRRRSSSKIRAVTWLAPGRNARHPFERMALAHSTGTLTQFISGKRRCSNIGVMAYSGFASRSNLPLRRTKRDPCTTFAAPSVHLLGAHLQAYIPSLLTLCTCQAHTKVSWKVCRALTAKVPIHYVHVPSRSTNFNPYTSTFRGNDIELIHAEACGVSPP